MTYVRNLAASTLEILNVTAACAVFGKIVVFLSYRLVAIISVIIAVVANSTLIMVGNTALAVLIFCSEAISGNTVRMYRISVVYVMEAIYDNLIAGFDSVIVIGNSVTTVDVGVIIRYYRQITLGAYSGIYGMISTLIVGVILIITIH